MNVLQITSHFNPKFGGEVNVCYNLSMQLAKKGHSVTILTSDSGFDKSYAKGIEAYGVEIIAFQTLINFGLFVFTPSINQWLTQNVKKFDIIHMHTFRSYQNNCAMNFALKNNIPYIVQAHGSVLPSLNKQKLKKIYDILWGDMLLKNASKLIAVSKTEKNQYLSIRILESRIEIIPNGIDIFQYETLPEFGKFRKKYKIESDMKIILYLGRLYYVKGIDFLIDGFSSLLNEYNKIILVIAGPDSGFLDTLTTQVNKLKIEDKVIFTGFLPENEKYEALVDADVLVSPGMIEIFGLVPFEAIMCGTPVIVNDDCGCGEIIKEGRCGSVTKYGDTSELSIKIRNILDYPDNAKENVKFGQQFIKENLSWEIIVERFLKLYYSCLKL
jgi:glycosyltransferase involved in cell wall biosynthesis